MEMETTVPCAPMGTAAIRIATKIASSMKNRSLNAAVTIRYDDVEIIIDEQVCKKVSALQNGCCIFTFNITS